MKSLPKVRSRVKRGAKLSKHEILRRLRLGDLRRIICDRCHGLVLPDNDAGRGYLRELLLPISLGPNEAAWRNGRVNVWGPADRMGREIESWAPWMSEDEAAELIGDINLTPEWQRKPMARTLGKRLNVTYGERARLGLRTIGPCDMTGRAMRALRKQNDRQRKRLQRQRQPRAEYLVSHHISRTRPWEQEGISRAKWYRQRHETGVSAINLTNTEDRLVSDYLKILEGLGNVVVIRRPPLLGKDRPIPLMPLSSGDRAAA